MKLSLFIAPFFAFLAGCSNLAPMNVVSVPVPVHDQSAVASRGFFYAGGKYVGDQNNQIMSSQIYVEVVVPKKVKRPYPLVLIHGAAQSATNWMGTPDGRKGWADYFVEQGFIVYMIDQPQRGRSAWHPSDGNTKMFSAPTVEKLFTATESLGTWPQAKAHTQWPGSGANKGKRGDPIFDAFYATQLETLNSYESIELNTQSAVVAMLDRIGPSMILTHSGSGPMGWLIADARPELVKAIVAIEPSGPPFENATLGSGRARLWGPTDTPITYEPAISKSNELMLERQVADSPDLFACWMQKSPARQLVNLNRIPVLVISSEASYHAAYDHCTARYLKQAGVPAEFLRLEDKGIHGNGHMMMLEKNNLEIAHVIDEWFVSRGP